MKTLLIVAHGSRRSAANEEIQQLTQTVASRSGDRFEQVECAFLELADPSIQQGIDALVASGATSILVLPYFLAQGAHVASDIPQALEQCKQNHPEIEITMTPYLGSSSALPALMVELATVPSATV